MSSLSSRPGVETYTTDRDASQNTLIPGNANGWPPLALEILIGVGAITVALVILYRRITGDDVLEHDLRSRILEIVRDNPAINESNLAEKLDVHPSTIAHHCILLQETGYLSQRRAGREKLFFPTNGQAHDRLDKETLTALRSEAKRRLVKVLIAEPGLSVTETARRLDCHPSTVTRHANSLANQNVLDERSEDGQRVLAVRDDMKATISTVLDGA